MASSVAVKMAKVQKLGLEEKKKIIKELPEKVIDSEPIIINTLNDMIFYNGWAEHFWKLAEQYAIEPDRIGESIAVTELYKEHKRQIINGLRNKAGEIMEAIEDYKSEHPLVEVTKNV